MNPEKIPLELREREQWCNFIVGPGVDQRGRLTKNPVISGSFAELHPSSTDERSWRSFERACMHRERHIAEERPGQCFVAYVLRKPDNLVFLDIDEGTPEEDIDTLLEAFPNAYVEESASGKGLHVLFRGSIEGAGRRKGHLELYDTARWVIMTGNPLAGNETIGEGDPFELRELEKQMDSGVFHTGGVWEEIPDQQQIDTDEVVLAKCLEQHRSGKFQYLYYDGNWQCFNYVSQSEGDFALIGMLAGVSRNNEQVKRLFLASKLYRPAKSHTIFYSLRRLRAKQAESDRTDQWFTEMANKNREEYLQATPRKCPNSDKIFPPPKGLLRDLYLAFMDWAYYPVREPCLIAALVTALSIFQRKYQTPTNLGLNMWLFLLGDAGAGKDVLKRGPKALLTKAKVPIDGLLGGQIRGDRGLVDSLRNNPRQCAYHPECASWLRNMCYENSPPQFGNLRDALTSSWTDSTTTLDIPQRMLERNGKRELEILRPCLTLYGESVPEFFYDAVGTSQIAGGFMPRFSVLEVDCTPGLLPLDPGPQNPFPARLLDVIHKLGRDAAEHDAVMADPTVVPWANREAKVAFDEYQREIRVRQASKNGNPIANYRNTLIGRSAEKVIKLATLLALCENAASPSATGPAVGLADLKWAIEFVTATDTRMINQLVSGEHDAAQHNQLQNMRNVIMKAAIMGITQRAKSQYFGKPSVINNPNLVPYGWLNQQCRNIPCFKNARLGTEAAINNTIRELVNTGEIIEYTPDERAKQKWTGRMFLNIGVGMQDEH